LRAGERRRGLAQGSPPFRTRSSWSARAGARKWTATRPSWEADRKSRTGLEGYLDELGIKRLFVCGLATDFCVAWTALDACKLGFDCAVIEDACRAIDMQGSFAAALEKMKKAGVARVQSGSFA